MSYEYSSFCWNCKKPINNSHARCPKCGWYICVCGCCSKGCDAGYERIRIRREKEKQETEKRREQDKNNRREALKNAMKTYNQQNSEYLKADIIALLVGYAFVNMKIGDTVSQYIYEDTNIIDDRYLYKYKKSVIDIVSGDLQAFSGWIQENHIQTDEKYFLKYYEIIKNERLTPEIYRDYLNELNILKQEENVHICTMEKKIGYERNRPFIYSVEIMFESLISMLFLLSRIRNAVINAFKEKFEYFFISYKDVKDLISLVIEGDQFYHDGWIGCTDAVDELISKYQSIDRKNIAGFSEYSENEGNRAGYIFRKNLNYMMQHSDEYNIFYRLIKVKRIDKFYPRNSDKWQGDWKYSVIEKRPDRQSKYKKEQKKEPSQIIINSNDFLSLEELLKFDTKNQNRRITIKKWAYTSELTKNVFKVGNYDLICEWADDGPYNRRVNPNNLYIEGLWKMEETAVKNDACIYVQITGKDTFTFGTWFGGRYQMKIINGQVKCISKKD